MDNMASNNKTKILVVDDNLLNRKLACAVLKSYNLDFEIAENGKIAYQYFLTGDYDLILMDIQMPIMTGIECTQKIREYESNSNSSTAIPIIAVTTFTMSYDKKNCFDAGMNGILAKPYKTCDMIDMISKYINIEEHDNHK
jgi:CheY-like chemotaxis protein